MTEPLPITMTVDRFKKLSGLGKTSIYELIASGDLQSARILGRRMIVVQSYVDLIGRSFVVDRMRSLETAE